MHSGLELDSVIDHALNTVFFDIRKPILNFFILKINIIEVKYPSPIDFMKFYMNLIICLS